MKKRIDTVLDEELWKEAQFANVKWSEALEMGVRMMVGSDNTEDKIRKDIKRLNSESSFLSKKLEKMVKHKKAAMNDDSLIKDNLDMLEKAAEAVGKNINFLKGRTKAWINKTGMYITPEDFYQLCKRFERGEFNVKKKEVKT